MFIFLKSLRRAAQGRQAQEINVPSLYKRVSWGAVSVSFGKNLSKSVLFLFEACSCLLYGRTKPVRLWTKRVRAAETATPVVSSAAGESSEYGSLVIRLSRSPVVRF